MALAKGPAKICPSSMTRRPSRGRGLIFFTVSDSVMGLSDNLNSKSKFKLQCNCLRIYLQSILDCGALYVIYFTTINLLKISTRIFTPILKTSFPNQYTDLSSIWAGIV